jgi:hypothetical protein
MGHCGARISLARHRMSAVRQAVHQDDRHHRAWVFPPDDDGHRWLMLHVQSNPLPICTRPRVLIKGKRT